MWRWLFLGLTAVVCLWMSRSWSSVLRSAAVLRSTGSAYDQCPNVFIDLGANTGGSVEAFLNEAERQRLGSPVLEKDQKRLAGFFAEQNWNVKDFCIYVFEGAPIFTEKLRALETAAREKGFKIEVFPDTVVSSEDGVVKFLIDEHTQRRVGSTIATRKDTADRKAIDVPSVRLSRFIRERIDPRSMVFIKMDVEGAEYKILPDLLSEGLLCPGPTAEHRYIDMMNVEFHCKLLRGPLSEGLDYEPGRQCYSDSLWPYLLEGCGVKYDKRTD